MELSRDLECAICLQNFVEPSLLPCGHTFCLRCIEGCSKTCGHIRCPECRQIYPVPKSGIQRFPRNYTVMRILSDGPPSKNNAPSSHEIIKTSADSNCGQCDVTSYNTEKQSEYRSPPSVRLEQSKELEVQFYTAPKVLFIRKIRAKTTEDTQVPYLGDLQVLDNGTVSVIDGFNRKVKTFHKSGHLMSQFGDEKSIPLFICGTNASAKVMVSNFKKTWAGEVGHIAKWNVKSMAHRTMNVNLKDPQAISLTRYQNETVGAIADKKLKVVKLFDIKEGREFGGFKINVKPGTPSLWIAGHPKVNGIVVHDYRTLTFYKDGCKVWTCKDQLEHPHGMTMLSDGSVIVADIQRNKILLVSPAGIVVDTILSENDGLDQPIGVSYCERQHLLAITEEDKTYFKLYYY